MTTEQRQSEEKVNVVREARLGNREVVKKWLLSKDGPKNTVKQQRVLYTAAECGHTDICRLIVDSGNVTDDNMLSAIRQACAYGQLPVVQLLINELPNQYRDFSDLLHAAASRGHFQVVDWLLPLTQPADADYLRWNLVVASAMGDLKATNDLVKKVGADVEVVMSHALWAACYNNKIVVVNYLTTRTLADGRYSRVLDATNGALTPPALACHEGYFPIAILLLENLFFSDYDWNTLTGRKANTTLHEAIWGTGPTLLHVASNHGDYEAVVNLLYEEDFNAQDNNGSTPLHCACINNYVDIARALLSVFASTEITDDNRLTAVDVCKQSGFYELVGFMSFSIFSPDVSYTTSVRDVDFITTSSPVRADDQTFSNSTYDPFLQVSKQL